MGGLNFTGQNTKPGLPLDGRGKPGFFVLLLIAVALGACGSKTPPPKQYAITGQILDVLAERQSLTIRHEDITGLMPAMTMTFQVADPGLMNGRAAGETIVGTLEVGDTSSRLTSITHTGSAPVPVSANALAMADGILAEGDQIPDAALVDQRDQRFSVADWKGAITLLTFTYTTCPLPDFCPLIDEHFASIQRDLAKDPKLHGQVRLVSVSFDPEHDTPAVLAAHARKRRADSTLWTFATGDERTVARFAGRFGVTVVHEKDGSITHSLRTFLIGRDGRIRKIYPGNDWKTDRVLADIQAAVRES